MNPPRGLHADSHCMKWGTAYGAEDVNILYSMVQPSHRAPASIRLLHRRRLEPAAARSRRCRCRRSSCRRAFSGHPGARSRSGRMPLADLDGNALFLDLDVVVTGNIDAFFDFRPDAPFCVAENWTQRGRGIGNTSVFRLQVGQPSRDLRSPAGRSGGCARRVFQRADIGFETRFRTCLLAGRLVPELQARSLATLAAEFRQGAPASLRAPASSASWAIRNRPRRARDCGRVPWHKTNLQARAADTVGGRALAMKRPAQRTRIHSAAGALTRFVRRSMRSLKWAPQLRRLKRIRGIGNGRRAFLVGSGPSLAAMDLGLLDDDFVCVLNMAVRALGRDLARADMHVMNDTHGYQRFAEEIETIALAHPIPHRFLNIRARQFWRRLPERAQRADLHRSPHRETRGPRRSAANCRRRGQRRIGGHNVRRSCCAIWASIRST